VFQCEGEVIMTRKECLENAERCEQRATEEQDPEDISLYAGFAREWRELAQVIEQQQRQRSLS
jgi:hypothetical protein